MPHHDVAHLASLIEAAKSQAEKVGPPAGAVASRLAEALVAARSLEAQGGRADEGLRPEDLTTDNDK